MFATVDDLPEQRMDGSILYIDNGKEMTWIPTHPYPMRQLLSDNIRTYIIPTNNCDHLIASIINQLSEYYKSGLTPVNPKYPFELLPWCHKLHITALKIHICWKCCTQLLINIEKFTEISFNGFQIHSKSIKTHLKLFASTRIIENKCAIGIQFPYNNYSLLTFRFIYNVERYWKKIFDQLYQSIMDKNLDKTKIFYYLDHFEYFLCSIKYIKLRHIEYILNTWNFPHCFDNLWTNYATKFKQIHCDHDDDTLHRIEKAWSLFEKTPLRNIAKSGNRQVLQNITGITRGSAVCISTIYGKTLRYARKYRSTVCKTAKQKCHKSVSFCLFGSKPYHQVKKEVTKIIIVLLNIKSNIHKCDVIKVVKRLKKNGNKDATFQRLMENVYLPLSGVKEQDLNLVVKYRLMMCFSIWGSKDLDYSKITSDRNCNYCYAIKSKMMICQRCKVVYYCNKKCQKRDWKYHNHKLLCIKAHGEQ
eukprot:285950_1